jgi:hypothetical protein
VSLQIRGLHHDEATAREPEARAQRRREALIPALLDHHELGDLELQLAKNLRRPIRTAVIDNDDLTAAADCACPGQTALHELAEVLLLVVGRSDDGNLRTGLGVGQSHGGSNVCQGRLGHGLILSQRQP